MSVSQIEAASLTTFEVDADGSSVRLYVRDRGGRPACLVLPTACVNQLLMSLPRMVQTALRNAHGDDSLRVAHPIESYRIELGEPSAAGVPQFILTLETSGGFAVSFAASGELLGGVARSIFGDVLSCPAEHERAARCS